MLNNQTQLEQCTCTECGHTNKVESIDLWTLCEGCCSHLVSDSEVLALEAA